MGAALFVSFLSLFVVAALLKVAAFFLGRIKIRWEDAVLYGFLSGFLYWILGFPNSIVDNFFTIFALTDRQIPFLLSLLAVSVQVMFARWYLKDRARNADGEGVGPRGGMLLFLWVFIMFWVLQNVGSLLLHWGGT
jgi:hypothetical protein